MDFMTHLGVAELVSHALCFGYDTIGRAPVSVNPSQDAVAHLFDTVRRCRFVTVLISNRLPRSHRLLLPLGSYIPA